MTPFFEIHCTACGLQLDKGGRFHPVELPGLVVAVFACWGCPTTTAELFEAPKPHEFGVYRVHCAACGHGHTPEAPVMVVSSLPLCIPCGGELLAAEQEIARLQ